jgi:hypothetical protein
MTGFIIKNIHVLCVYFKKSAMNTFLGNTQNLFSLSLSPLISPSIFDFDPWNRFTEGEASVSLWFGDHLGALSRAYWIMATRTPLRGGELCG